jgi:hypothetical protein
MLVLTSNFITQIFVLPTKNWENFGKFSALNSNIEKKGKFSQILEIFLL